VKAGPDGLPIMEICIRNIPARISEVTPFQVNAERITAGQNGATFSDQSAAFISCIKAKEEISFTPKEQ